MSNELPFFNIHYKYLFNKLRYMTKRKKSVNKSGKRELDNAKPRSAKKGESKFKKALSNKSSEEKVKLIHEIVFHQSNPENNTFTQFIKILSSLTDSGYLYRYRKPSSIDRLVSSPTQESNTEDSIIQPNVVGINSFKTGHKVRCTPPVEFNDPYDTWYYASIGNNIDYRRRFITLFCADISNKFESTNPNNSRYISKNIENFQYDCVGYATSDTYLDDIRTLCHKNMKWMSDEISDMNEIELILKRCSIQCNTEIKKEFEKKYISDDHLCKNLGVVCFSSDFKSLLMWSHYADFHKGFCLKYDAKNIPGDLPKIIKFLDNMNHDITYKDSHPKRLLVPILYLDHMLPICETFTDSNITGLQHHLHIIECCSCKSKVWEYEKEWRLIVELDDPAARDIDINKPVGIYLGSLISSDHEAKLRKYGKDLNIPVKKLHLDLDTFRLNVCE